MADRQSLDVVVLGDVSIWKSNDFVWKLQKVRHISQLKKNLIFLGQLDDSGHSVNFGVVSERSQKELWW